MTSTLPEAVSGAISDHARPADVAARKGFGPRVRRLHARIGAAHHKAEGMDFSRALLAGQASPLQLAGLIRALGPAYALIEQTGPELAAALGAPDLPWSALSRSEALRHDVALLAGIEASGPSAAAQAWLGHLGKLAQQAPHRFLAHVYVRYGGDLSGGQQLAQQANAILAAHGLPSLRFWQFERPIPDLKQALHDAFEQLELSEAEEAELLEEAVTAFLDTQSLLAELGELTTPRADPLPLLLKYDKPVPRYTSYPTAAAFHDGVGPADLVNQLGQASTADLSLYVHVPFCRHACWYCGCNRITTQAGSAVVGPYLEALAKELTLVSQASGRRRRLGQLHWGGGTPNYLNSQEQGQLWDLIGEQLDLAPDLEASIEVNPEFLSRDQVLELRRLGFNRISFGIQDADPNVQAAVNRIVPVEQLRRAMEWMREAAFESVNVDLICGLPLQTPERFARTIALVRELRPDRVSLFSFAYLPEQLPMQRKIAADDLPSQRERIRMLQHAFTAFTGDGYDAIGMDHFALSSDSLAVAARQERLHRNFQGYTTGGERDLLGIGVTAISQFQNLFSQNQRSLKAYVQALDEGHLPVERGLVVRDPEVLLRRSIIQSLMCHFAVDFDTIALGQPLEAKRQFASEWAELQILEADGLVRLGANSLEVTEVGRWLIRTIAAVFDPSQRRQASGSRLI
ncbi:oxygen-independent coproporphyrinogen III oxidase [Synechococcus sp. J7-Johnson]|uniref:oxygen-independent coproporphyrinogen III oxidase n=1 Tax=Synechococcus sp. J7-Johnson TaxID=2823737 RepID=UPI0020CC8990|nr:oxygen-independent coproporphyrinogen III oxidase [Synechococcus sp. J7-Johnson]